MVPSARRVVHLVKRVENTDKRVDGSVEVKDKDAGSELPLCVHHQLGDLFF